MHLSKAMLGLPPSLLLLLAMQLGGGCASAAQGQQQKRSPLPTAIRKMSLDEGEKFMPEYYAFAPEPSFAEAQSSPASSSFWARSLALTPEEEALLALNSSAAIRYRPPFPRHYDYRRAAADADAGAGGRRLYRRARDALARLQGRQFSCPDNTASCDNIDQPNYCCVEGTTCFVVTDSPDAGNVGCCPEGQNCGGSVGTCTDDSTACPADVGGGCCVPGFVCAEVGCVASSVSVITSTTVTSTVVTSPTPTTQIITVVVTVTPSATPATSTVTQTTTAGASSSSSSITTTTTTAAGIPPVRPTSSGSQTSSPAPTTTSASTDAGYCPTGFYACLATAGSGCCRTGRDCSTTSCPPPPAMTTYTANGVTVAVPAADASRASAAGPDAAPTCAAGWFMCTDAGCCPDGYVCGTASCTLSAAAETATVQKEMPGGGGAAGVKGMGMGMGRMIGGGLVAWGLVWGWQGGLLG
ncbi:hypothetical protein F4775DRAFT_373243 [Biscogniauxia sp. FL1348]|nr:hypothetical protein F4775DRAFT_373243 [Biscogniauxia sp. FL1348]